MTAKPTEEGWFWEWRTFGEIPPRVVDRLARYEVRGEPGTAGRDFYFVSDVTDQNVKLRGRELLKLKPLLARLADGVELYEETARLNFALPAPPDAVGMAGSLLGVEVEAGAPLNWFELKAALMAAPGVRFVPVRKRRTQYVVGGGWAELAELEFPGGTVRSLGVQSGSISETRRLRDQLDPAGELEPLNYVGACRRWSGPA
jgi:hypothetical protein